MLLSTQTDVTAREFGLPEAVRMVRVFITDLTKTQKA